jgi:hypothetical protein
MNDLAFVKNLRSGFLIFYVLAWNALLGLGLWIDGSMKGGPAFSALFAVALLSTSLLCLAIIFLPGVQAICIRATSQVGLIRKELWITCIFTGVLGIVAFFGAFTMKA